MTDRYLKGVLTVIAAALVWIAVQLSIGTAQAAKEGDAAQMFRRESVENMKNTRPGDQLVVPVYCVNCR